MNHVGDINIDDKLRKASAEAAQLKAHLSAATNMKTGTLDFTKLSRSLKDSGVSLQHYGETLRAMGPEGQKAFSQLARAVAQSEVPIRRTNKLVKEMGTTLKNSLRWQLSSSILHGFMTSMQDAYNYAKNLNSSLTDIRIVSGQSADQMARFAKQANIAAKDLSTTTNEYAKAALIYYQQGLKQQEVLERTEVTVKMANVTGDAEQDVSSYMTAIWNNFNKAGDESVEHFADIMTKLGAATAASTSEIAAGLSKFSAVADTIGLSFEMATSAVTAIVDQTRETPEVVGTALKTIFSRIEGLQQGETMEDGVNLNKYSKGLQKVGVDIMDTNGKLKDADQILNEIGNKWETLDKNQQVALAQTTAGVRQYNQFMALFDNWDKVQQNLTLAATAEGTLDQQADIYAESWEAASKRVRASLEGLFDSLLEDDFFIGLLNGFSELIGFIEGTVDALGGMKGVLLAIGAILTKVFSQQMAGGLQNMAHNLQMLTSKGRQSVIDEKRNQLNALANAKDSGNSGYGDMEGAARQRSIRDSVYMQDRFIGAQDKMTGIQRDTAKALLDNQAAQAEKTAGAAREADNAKKVQDDARARVTENIASKSLKSDGSFSKSYFDSESKRFNQAMQEINADSKAKANISQIFDDIGKKGEVATKDIKKLGKAVAQIDPKGTGELAKLIPKVGDSASEAEGKMKALSQRAEELSEKKASKKLKGFVEGESAVRGFVRDADEREGKRRQYTTEHVKEKKGAKDYDNYMNKLEGPKPSVATGFVSIANAAASAMMVVTMLSGAISTLKNPDASGWDKLLAIFGALGVAIPILTSSFTMLANAESIAGVKALAEAVATKASAAAKKDLSVKTLASAASQKIQAIATKSSAAAMTEDAAATAANTGATAANTGATSANALAQYKQALGTVASSLGKLIAAHPIIAAGVVAVAAAVWIGVKAWNADAEAAQKAAKAAAEAQKAYEDAASAHDETTSSIDSYKSATESLETLTKGTIEWTEAVNKCNQEVISLLEKFPELSQYIENVDGKMEISGEGLAYIQKQSQNELNAAYNSALLANVNAQDAKFESDKTNFLRDTGRYYNEEEHYGGNVSRKLLDQALEKSQEIGTGFLSSPEAIMEALGVTKGNAEALHENSEAIIELSNQMSVNSATNELVAEQIGMNALGDNADFKNASERAQSIYAKEYGEAFIDESNALYDGKYSLMSDKEIQKQYAEMIGADDSKNKSDGTGQYLIDGQWQTYTDEMARKALAEAEATANLEGFSGGLITATSALEGFAAALLNDESFTGNEAQADALAEYAMTGDASAFDQLSDTDREALLKMLPNIDFENLDVDWSKAKVGSDQIEKGATAGIETANENAAETRETNKTNFMSNVSQGAYSSYNATVDEYGNVQNADYTPVLTAGGRNVGAMMGVAASSDWFGNSEYQSAYATTTPYEFTEGQNQAIQGAYDEAELEGLDVTSINAEQGAVIGEAIGKYLRENPEATNEEVAAKADELISDQAKENEINSYISDEGLDIASVEEYSEHLQNIAKTSDEIDDSLADDPLGAKQVAAATKATDKALENLNETLDEYQDILKDTNKKHTPEYLEGMKKMKTALADYLDTEEDMLSDKFIEEHMDELVDGSEDAMNSIRMDWMKEKFQIEAETNIDVANALPEIEAGIADLEAQLPDIDLNGYANLDTTGFDEAVNQLLATGALTVGDINNMFAGTGYAPVIQSVEVDSESQIPSGVVDGHVTWSTQTKNATFDGESMPFTVPVPHISMRGSDTGGSPMKGDTKLATFGGNQYAGGGGRPRRAPQITGIKKISNGTGSGGGRKGGSGGGGGGGGGSKASKIKKAKKSDIVKRYKEVTDDLQDVTRAQEKASKSAERLYGPKRISAMKEVNRLLEREIQMLQERKLSEASSYLEEDKKELLRVWKSLNDEFGMGLPGLIFDTDGNIDNYTEVMETIWNQIDAIQSKYGDESEIDEATQKQIDDLTERAKRLEEVIGQYDETLNLVEEINDEIEEKQREIQDNNYEIITYNLEFEIELNDAELEKIDYFFNKTQKDNIYDMAEGLMIYGKRWEQLSDSAEHYINTYNELQKQFEEGKISEDKLMEGQKEMISNLIENAEQMQEFLEYATHEYYKETLEMGIEEIDKYAEGFDRLSDAVDHYMNIASTLGKETDYEYIEKFLNANISNINNKLDASTEKYNMLVEQRNYWEAELGKYEYGSTEYEQVKKNLEATNEAVEEAYDERLSIVEEKAEAIRALIENKMAQAAKSLENALTDGSGFDSLMDGFEKLNSRQEEYLTKTNQIYETNKLMRQAAQAADKTDNEVAKRKLKNFEDETKSLQQNTKLSNYELEIQQAKYDLLLAEIALEEAQNAKSTVRLQRDNEGNFGYVYTANKDEIADAQQQYEDAQNALYNISLQGQQDYTAKYLESLQMMQEELAELDEKWLNGEIDTIEEYNRQRDAITDHYFNPDTGVLTTYSKLYNVAVQTDANATEDYWGKSYGNMTTRTEEWKTAVNGYIAEIDTAFDLWVTSQTELNNDLNGTLEDNARFTEDVKTKSAALAETITTSVIPAVQQEIKEVEELTQKWIDYIATMESAIKENEKIIDPEKFKSWRDYGENFDFLREAIRQSQGMGTTDLSIDEALNLRKQKILDSPDLWEQLGYSGTKEEVAAQIDEDHAGVKNSLTRGNAQTGWSSYTQGYLHSIAESDSKVYSLDEILRDYTDYSFDMLMLSGDEKYKKYAAYSSYEEAAKARRQKVSSPWQAYSLEILFERAKHESKLAKYLEDLRATFDADNSKYPEIKPEESGIAQDIGNAIKAYASGDTSGYIKNDSDMKEALESRKAVADHFNNLPEDERAFTIGTDDELKEIYKKFGVSFDTGGYTGSWGPQGKLAMLHQKELVLNASDTENMLKMIEIVRDLSQQIDMFAARQSLQNSLLSNPGYFSTMNGVLEQNVHIEASFPGVTDRNQIEEAFGNLVNIAYQHANRR